MLQAFFGAIASALGNFVGRVIIIVVIIAVVVLIANN